MVQTNINFSNVVENVYFNSHIHQRSCCSWRSENAFYHATVVYQSTKQYIGSACAMEQYTNGHYWSANRQQIVCRNEPIIRAGKSK